MKILLGDSFSITAIKVETGERLNSVHVNASTLRYSAVQLIRPSWRADTLKEGGFDLTWNLPARPNPYPVSYYEVTLRYRYYEWDDWDEETYRVNGDRTDFFHNVGFVWPYRTTYAIQVQAVFETVDANGVEHVVRSPVAKTSVTTPGERPPKEEDGGD